MTKQTCACPEEVRDILLDNYLSSLFKKMNQIFKQLNSRVLASCLFSNERQKLMISSRALSYELHKPLSGVSRSGNSLTRRNMGFLQAHYSFGIRYLSNGLNSRKTKSGDENNGNENRSPIRRAALTGAGLLTLAMTKTKWVLAAAKLTKFTSVFSMLASSAVYGMFFGFPFAIGMVGLIAIHEAVSITMSSFVDNKILL